jgi:hypothetical protein
VALESPLGSSRGFSRTKSGSSSARPVSFTGAERRQTSRYADRRTPATGSRSRWASSRSALSISRKGWSFAPSPSWPATTRSSHCKSASRTLPTMPTWKKCT